jgi:hypothetical protein
LLFFIVYEDTQTGRNGISGLSLVPDPWYISKFIIIRRRVLLSEGNDIKIHLSLKKTKNNHSYKIETYLYDLIVTRLRS